VLGSRDQRSDSPIVPPTLNRLAAYSWRLIAIGVVVVAGVWLISRLRLALIPVVIALFLSRALAPVSMWLRSHRWPGALAAATTMLGFFLVIAGLLAAITPAIADEVDSLEPTVTQALDDVEDWLVDDSPFDVSRGTIDRLRERTGERVDGFFRESDSGLLDRSTLAAEVLAAALLALILTFFMLRDGQRFVDWSLRQLPFRHRANVHRAARGGWFALGGFLRGAAMLGLVESITIGLTLFLVGGDLVVPVMILTFMAAFVPIVGAVAAGVLAVLVALVTAGVVPALIVAGVAFAVQQLDNDILAPVIYGKALDLHPVTILLSLAAGTSLFGFAGTLLAVPVVAVSVNVVKALRSSGAEDGDPSGGTDGTGGEDEGESSTASDVP
jgi:putative heme transporter